jgi:phosphinothricin acetyltransferase
MMARAGAGPAVRVRDARRGDLAGIREIYAHHVLHGLASFEETPPDLAEVTRRFEATLAHGLPYLAAEAPMAEPGVAEPGVAGPGAELALRGYAYAGPYRPRPAYRYSVENSLYVAPGLEGRGIGRVLLEELIRRCTALGYRQMIAVIGDSGHLPSIKFHESLGFTQAGHLRSVGFKFERWVDSVILQRPLGPGDASLPDVPPPDEDA